MLITKTCVRCGRVCTVDVPMAGYVKWRSGEAHIQDALPDTSVEDREVLLSGICPQCWDDMYEE